MRRFFMFWKFIGLLAFFYTFAMATSQIRLEGMVTDLAGFPIENAQVRLVKNHLNAYTDSNGYFLLFQEETDVLRQSNFAVENPRLKPVFKDGFVRLESHFFVISCFYKTVFSRFATLTFSLERETECRKNRTT